MYYISNYMCVAWPSSPLMNFHLYLPPTLLSKVPNNIFTTSPLSPMAQTPPPNPNPPSPTRTLCQHDQLQPTNHLNSLAILAAIFCAFVCALGLNSMLRCVFQCANRALTEPVQWVASRRLNSGLKKKEMVALPTSTYNADLGTSPSSSGCTICLADFSDGEKIRVLPKCNHRFHVACIDKWLLCHASCPTCRHRLKSSDSMSSLNEIVTT